MEKCTEYENITKKSYKYYDPLMLMYFLVIFKVNFNPPINNMGLRREYNIVVLTIKYKQK